MAAEDFLSKQENVDASLTPIPTASISSGRVNLADVGGGVMNVTFEPGCRNNWHIHHKDVQEGASNEWLEASPQIVH